MFTNQELLSSLVTSTLQALEDDLFKQKQVTVSVLIDETGPVALRGNKWHKLKYNLLEASRLEKNTLLTFGGAFSNHIAATACAASKYSFQSIGIIRGEATHPLNKTLQEALENGMQLHFESRENYRNKEKPEYISELQKLYGDFYLIPEGGSNQFALMGSREILQFISIPFDFICCPCGTGATLAGLVSGLNENQSGLGFSVLKGGKFLSEKISELLDGEKNNRSNLNILTDYHFGGYGKITSELLDFTNQFEKKHTIKIEPIYTGKMFYGVYDLIRNDYFKRGSHIVAIHTGGMQYLMR